MLNWGILCKTHPYWTNKSCHNQSHQECWFQRFHMQDLHWFHTNHNCIFWEQISPGVHHPFVLLSRDSWCNLHHNYMRWLFLLFQFFPLFDQSRHCQGQSKFERNPVLVQTKACSRTPPQPGSRHTLAHSLIQCNEKIFLSCFHQEICIFWDFEGYFWTLPGKKNIW